MGKQIKTNLALRDWLPAMSVQQWRCLLLSPPMETKALASEVFGAAQIGEYATEAKAYGFGAKDFAARFALLPPLWRLFALGVGEHVAMGILGGIFLSSEDAGFGPELRLSRELKKIEAVMRMSFNNEMKFSTGAKADQPSGRVMASRAFSLNRNHYPVWDLSPHPWPAEALSALGEEPELLRVAGLLTASRFERISKSLFLGHLALMSASLALAIGGPLAMGWHPSAGLLLIPLPILCALPMVARLRQSIASAACMKPIERAFGASLARLKALRDEHALDWLARHQDWLREQIRSTPSDPLAKACEARLLEIGLLASDAGRALEAAHAAQSDVVGSLAREFDRQQRLAAGSPEALALALSRGQSQAQRELLSVATLGEARAASPEILASSPAPAPRKLRL